MIFPDKETQEMWLTRLKRVCMNEATHGIEIQSMEIDNAITQEYFKVKNESDKGAGNGKGKLEMSVWDFAGQHDYYNNHHYFLSTRTVFMVLWRMSDGEEAYKGLDFWFRSLVTHLSSSVSSSATKNAVYYSVIVVGTFLDHPSVLKDGNQARQSRVRQLAQECQFFAPLDAFCHRFEKGVVQHSQFKDIWQKFLPPYIRSCFN